MSDPAVPIDTSKVKLPDELIGLTEHLAANVHHHWMQQRKAEQWHYGEKRDDNLKQTPLLVAYSELPESEKEYDRITATETLKSILALGFTIAPPASNGLPALAEEALARLESLQRLSDLLSARRMLYDSKVADPRAYRTLAQHLLRKGEPLIAYDVARDGLELGADVRLQQLEGLALARCGAIAAAHQTLSSLWESGHVDAETSGMLARTHKDLWLKLCDKCEGAGHLEKSHALYKAGYELASRQSDVDGAIYNGINAAATALWMGNQAAASSLAEAVATLCDQRIPPDYWSLASQAEAALVRGKLESAEKLYSDATRDSAASPGDLSSTRKQARLLLAHFGEDPQSFDRCFPVPPIRVVRTALRLGQTTKPYDELRRQADAVVSGDSKHFLYICVLAHPDLAVLEACLDRGHEAHVILPVSLEGSSMANGEISSEKIQAILGRCASVRVASSLRTKSSRVNTHYAELLRDGLALLHAQALDTELVTEDLVPAGDAMRLTAARVMATPPMTITSSKERVRAILFADAVNFSRLDEGQVEVFSREFLGAIAEVIHHSLHRPLLQKTWGDGFCFVFETLSDAGRFALELRDRITTTDWVALGLPRELNLRIALHAGPVFEIMDPITERKDYTGVHISRAARIEPKTPPGQVYASENFAAIAAAHKISDFRCEYAGQIPLAKGYGTFALYHVTGRDYQP